MAEFRLRNGEVILVDDDIAERMAGQTWNVSSAGTVGRSYWDAVAKRPRREHLHAVVMGQVSGDREVWAHKDGEWRNFQRDNLVLVPREKNIGPRRPQGDPTLRTQRSNTLGFRGVSAAGRKFRAMATVNGEQKYLGLFETPEEAARAYDRALVQQGLQPVNFPG